MLTFMPPDGGRGTLQDLAGGEAGGLRMPAKKPPTEASAAAPAAAAPPAPSTALTVPGDSPGERGASPADEAGNVGMREMHCSSLPM